MKFFTRADDIPAEDSLAISIWGRPKTGKTTFYLGNESLGISHMPLPMFVFNYDLGAKELIRNANQSIRDNLYLIDLVADDPNLTHRKAEEMVRKLEGAILEAAEVIKTAGQGTYVIDTVTEHWQVLQTALMPEESNPKTRRLEFGPANARYSQHLKWMKASGADVCLIQHAQEVYDDKGQATGLYKPHGNKRTDEIAQVVLQAWTSDDLRTGEKHNGMTINFCRQDRNLHNISLPNMDYPQLYDLIYGKKPEHKYRS